MLTVTASQVSFAYPRSPLIISDFSGEFVPGRVVCLQAPSGRGKTTLLAIIGGLLTASSGSIAANGQPVDRAARRSLCTWVLQSQNVLAARTAVDNVALGAARDTPSWATALQRAGALLDDMGLGGQHDAVAAELSGGERQRVCVARALNGGAPVILADEPTANLDREATLQVVRSLRSATTHGRVVIVASHDPEVASEADEVMSRW